MNDGHIVQQENIALASQKSECDSQYVHLGSDGKKRKGVKRRVKFAIKILIRDCVWTYWNLAERRSLSETAIANVHAFFTEQSDVEDIVKEIRRSLPYGSEHYVTIGIGRPASLVFYVSDSRIDEGYCEKLERHIDRLMLSHPEIEYKIHRIGEIVM